MALLLRVVLATLELEDDDLLTEAVLLRVGTPTLTLAPSEPRRTSLNSTVAPASPGRVGSRSVVPFSARNCFPPERKMAYDMGIPRV